MTRPRTTLAGNALVRTVLQGLAVVTVLAGWQGIQATLDNGPLSVAAVGRAGATAAGMALLAYVWRLVTTRRIEPLTIGLDALVRAGRTLLAGAAAAVIAAVVEAVRAYLLSGGRFDPTAISQVALTAAGMAVLAYLHRAVLDPSRVPSAPPPGPAANDTVGRLSTPYRRGEPTG
jgi:hypothetical protein